MSRCICPCGCREPISNRERQQSMRRCPACRKKATVLCTRVQRGPWLKNHGDVMAYRERQIQQQAHDPVEAARVEATLARLKALRRYERATGRTA